MARRIISIILLVLTVAFAAVPSFAAATSSAAMSLDQTTIEEDFLLSGFNPDDWFLDKVDNNPEIIFVTDYFDYDNNKLYLYVWAYYKDLPDIYHQFSYIGFVGRRTGENTLEDDPYDLVYITSDESNRFHKYRVDVTSFGYDYNYERKYDISYINFGTLDKRYFSVSYALNGTHKDKNIMSHYVLDQVINLSPKSTVYLTASSPKVATDGFGWRTAVYSVYFTVPKSYEDKNNFDYLRAIEFSYYEQLFNYVVTSEDNVWEELQTMKDVVFSTSYEECNSKYPNIYVDLQDVSLGSGGRSDYRFAINPEFDSLVLKGIVDTEVLNMKQVDDYEDENLIIPFEEVESFFDYRQDGQESNLTFDKIYIDDTFNIKSYSGDNKSLFESFIAMLGGFNDMYEANLDNVAPIVKIDDSFFAGYNQDREKWCGDHLVAEQDAADFKASYEAAKSNGDIMYIFRFAQRDYYARDCAIVETDFFEWKDNNGFYARGTAFNDFDIISLTYRKEDQDVIVPVNMTPIDIGPDIVGPTRTGLGDVFQFFNDLTGIMDFLKTIFGCLLIVTIVILITKPIGWLLNVFDRKKK